VYFLSTKNVSRESILAAATRLFHLQGYHGTGLNQILKESGAPKGSLYYHFPEGKEQLAIEAVQAMAIYIENDIKTYLRYDVDVMTAFQEHIRHIAEQFNNTDELDGVPIGLMAAETSLISEPLRKACQAAFEGWELLYAKRLIEAGYDPASAQKLGIVINSMIEGAITRSLTNKNGEPLQLIAEYIPILLKK
jgi:TetR/AcrR family transcriptional repressor of lmrAB and yxaGH operons